MCMWVCVCVGEIGVTIMGVFKLFFLCVWWKSRESYTFKEQHNNSK